MKITILGNCQVTPLHHFLKKIFIDSEVCELKYVFQVTESDRSEFNEQFLTSDFIIAQRVTPGFPFDFCTLDYLNSIFPEKVISFPVIYFDGYFPTIRYLKVADTVVQGPLHDYHIGCIYNDFINGVDLDSAVLNFNNEADLTNAKNFVLKSIENLVEREMDLNVSISDYISDHCYKQKIFYTPNHPHNHVIAEMAKRISGLINVKNGHRYSSSLSQNVHVDNTCSLSNIDIPIFPIMRSLYPMHETTDGLFKGFGFDIDIHKSIVTSNAKNCVSYNSYNLVSAFYEIYRHIL